MKKDLLNKMVEQFHENPYEEKDVNLGKSEIALVKYNNQYALVIDKKLNTSKQYRSYIDENGFPLGLPVFVLFNSLKDIERLKKLDTIVDTSVYVNEIAQEKFEQSKIINKGTCNVDSRYDTFILKDVSLKQFLKGTVLVVRVDSHNPGTISKTTNEIPARTYFQLKESMGGELGAIGAGLGGMAIGGTLMIITLSLMSLLTMGATMKGASKRRQDLETEFKSVIKDGKDWKVFIFPDDSPNAFAIVMPNIFVTEGLLKMLDKRELMSVMLHEAGHIRNFDVIKSVATHFSFIGSFLAAMLKYQGYAAFIAFIIMMVIMSSESYLYIKSRWLGRPAEYRADNYATKYGYGDELISALKKITEWVEKESSKRPCGSICEKFKKLQQHLDDHPELKDRIDAIIKSKETWQLALSFSFKKLREFISGKLAGG